jgi:hypothetical protein
MGGTLDLDATFPNTKPVKIVHIGDLADSEQLEDDATALAQLGLNTATAQTSLTA